MAMVLNNRRKDHTKPSAIFECMARSAISRSYYACFLYAKQNATNPNLAMPFDESNKKNVHKRLWQWYGGKAGLKLREMHSKRCHADYEILTPLEEHITDISDQVQDLFREIAAAIGKKAMNSKLP